ncbi:Clavaminate synthase-like protein [Bimuria novae-zelandiae CBS 107.79]|uniref:Clavaminate synthase-like protein n=1 Tax=Bimuria novae-zelandiae CBS 107.79 TaxID=1447943 RepID=A0A6A5V0Z3_9PLEO|nr:Clavaminate synthase-like protein [Bimuria novae-zelandiae CBS 107.79]
MPVAGVGKAPPILDFSAFYNGDAAAKKKLVDDAIMNRNKKFLDLSLEQKMEINKDTSNTWNRGYELLKSQILEEGTLPELKEGFYIGDEIPKTHPYFVNKKLNLGPNMVVSLANDILKVLAQTLELPSSYFDDFTTGAVATMRPLHYPSQPPDSPQKLTRGIGAHTDFGTMTILLQDTVAGLNYRYISNTHWVINQSGEERYLIPVLLSGNPDYVVECLPNCRAEGEEAKYAPITVEQAVLGDYADSYGRAEKIKKDAAAKGGREGGLVALGHVKDKLKKRNIHR